MRLGLGDFEWIHARYTHPILMHVQHDSRRIRMRFVKHGFQYFDDKFHRSVVVVKQNNLVERRFGGLRFGAGLALGNDIAIAGAAVAIAVAVTIGDSRRYFAHEIRHHTSVARSSSPRLLNIITNSGMPSEHPKKFGSVATTLIF